MEGTLRHLTFSFGEFGSSVFMSARIAARVLFHRNIEILLNNTDVILLILNFYKVTSVILSISNFHQFAVFDSNTPLCAIEHGL